MLFKRLLTIWKRISRYKYKADYMNTIELRKYGVAITQKVIAIGIFNDIKSMDPSNNVIVVDMMGVIAMTTQCANIIFGTLYRELGSDTFFQNIKIKNSTNAIKFVIDMGLDHAMKAKGSLSDASS